MRYPIRQRVWRYPLHSTVILTPAKRRPWSHTRTATRSRQHTTDNETRTATTMNRVYWDTTSTSAPWRPPSPARRSALASELQRVLALPGRASRAPDGHVELVSLAEAARLASGGRQAAQLAMLRDAATQPLRVGVATDRVVRRVDEHDLEVLVGRVLRHPVAAEHTQPAALTARSLL